MLFHVGTGFLFFFCLGFLIHFCFFCLVGLLCFFLMESVTRKPHRFLVCYISILSILFQKGKSRGQRWEHRAQLLNPLPLKVKYFYYTAQQEQQNTKSSTSLLKRCLFKKCILTIFNLFLKSSNITADTEERLVVLLSPLSSFTFTTQ